MGVREGLLPRTLGQKVTAMRDDTGIGAGDPQVSGVSPTGPTTGSTTDDPGPGVRHEALTSPEGRSAYFRPTRHLAASLPHVSARVEATVNGTSVRWAVHDISQTGVAVLAPMDSTLSVGCLIDRLIVMFDAHTVYSGRGHAASVRQHEGGLLCGIEFADALVDVDDIVQMNDLKGRVSPPHERLWSKTRAVETTGNASFKAQVGEMRLFLDEARHELLRLAADVPWAAVHGDSSMGTKSALLDMLRREFVPRFVSYSERIDASLRRSDRDEWGVLKDYSVRMLQDYFIQAPVLHRARYKPLTYAGDYIVMRYIYEQKLEGETLFAKALHLAAVGTRAAAAVRERKNLVRSRLQAALDASIHEDRPFTIISVAAGPAEEVCELLREATPAGQRVHLVLYDQDPGALAYAQGRISALVDAKWRHMVRVTYLRESIGRLLTDPYLFTELGPFDVLFCAGLYDYLTVETAVRLTTTFWHYLAPGGTAYIGNMHPDCPTRWIMEQHLKWFLEFRTEDQILDFGRRGAPEAELSVIKDATGVNPFLVMRRVS